MTAQARNVFLSTLLIGCVTLISSAPVGAQGVNTPAADNLPPELAAADDELRSFSLLPGVYIDTVTVTGSANNHLTGTFTVTNDSDQALAGLWYELLILGPPPEISANTLVWDEAPTYHRTTSRPSFSLTAKQTKSIPFEYQVPPLPDGSYRLRVQLHTAEQRQLGWQDVPVELAGQTGGYILLEEGSIVIRSTDPLTNEEKNEWTAVEGVNVDPNADITFRAQVRNVGSRALTAEPHIIVRRTLTAEPTVEETSLSQPLTLAPGAERTYTFTLPARSQPGPYQVILTFQENGQLVSGVGEYRYVVRGVSASLISPKVESLPQKAGETAEVSFGVAGSADRQTQLPGMRVRVELLKDNRVVASTDNQLAFEDVSAPIGGKASLQLQEDICGATALDLRIVVATETGQELDAYQVSLADQVSPCPEGQPAVFLSSSPLKPAWIVLIIALLTAGGLLGWYVWHKVSAGKPPIPPAAPTLLLIAGFILSASLLAKNYQPHVAQANGIQWIGGAATIATFPPNYLYINSPRHRSTYNATDTVPYSGYTQSWNCGNSVHVGTVRLYVLDGAGHVSRRTGRTWDLAFQRNLPGLNFHGFRTATFASRIPFPSYATGPHTTTFWTFFSSLYHHPTGDYNGIFHDFTHLNLIHPAPQVDLKVTDPAGVTSDGPVTVESGEEITLTWTSANDVTSCDASGAWAGSKPIENLTGEQYTPTDTVAYTINCRSEAGDLAQDSVTVNVTAPSPSPQFTPGGFRETE